MSCKSSIPFPLSNNASLQSQLNQTLWQMFSLNIPANSITLLGDAAFLSNIYCSTDSATQCYGICPNADLAGVGVRAAFWTSSILQAVLVAVSPEDSTQGAWAAAVLTASVIIPALIQKRQGNLSIYHATLVLNFATFASLVSLAVAPMCSVWRLGPTEEDDLRNDTCTSAITNPLLEVAVYGEEGPTDPNRDLLTNLPKRKVHRERLILSLALLTQVALQWAWVTMLFTDPNYYQKACVPDTVVLLFGFHLSVHDLNHDLFALWPLWLLFNLAITLVWGTLLVYSSSPSVHPILSRQPSRVYLTLTWKDRVPLDKGRVMVLLMNLAAFLLAVLLLVSSEIQVTKNCLVGGENTEWSFGQIAALLVALVPAWPILAAIERRLNDARQNSNVSALRDDTESNVHIGQGSSAPPSPSDGSQTPNENSIDTFEVTSIEEISVFPDTLPVPDRTCYSSSGRHRQGVK